MTSRSEYRERWLHAKVSWNDDGPSWVYVAASDYIPGLVKIGATRRTSPLLRLNNSMIPAPFVVATWREDPPWTLERKLHAFFQDVRVTGEWFRTTPLAVVKVVEQFKSE